MLILDKNGKLSKKYISFREQSIIRNLIYLMTVIPFVLSVTILSLLLICTDEIFKYKITPEFLLDSYHHYFGIYNKYN